MSARAAASEEPHSLLVEGTRVDLVLRRSARRSFTLQVDHRGARVSVPLRTPLGEVERFVHSHGSWLLDRLRARALAPQPPRLEVAEGVRLDFHSVERVGPDLRLLARVAGRAGF